MMNQKENSLMLLWLVVDLFVLTLSISIVHFFNVGDVQHTTYPYYIYLLYGLLSWTITYLVFTKKYLYLRDSYKHRAFRILKRVGIFTTVSMVVLFLFMKGGYSRIFILSYIAVFLVGELVVYKIIYFVLKARRNKGKSVKRALVIGYSNTSVQLKELFEEDSLLGYKFVGFVKYAERNIAEIPKQDHPSIVGDTSELEQVIKESQAEVVFSVFSLFRNNDNLQQQLTACNHLGVRLYLIPETTRWFHEGSNVESLGNLYIINPQHIPLDKVVNRLLKRSFDLFVSGFCILFVFSWLFPILAIIIRMTSKGPVFFRQSRTGLNNKTFQCYKFRSMYLNKDSDKKQTTSGDPRITLVGKFIRKHSIDELPQFFNVFIGHMSLVGPRPHMLNQTEEYSKRIEFYLTRHYIRPGITGWAQVNGYRGVTDKLWKMEKRVEYDIDYIERWNFWWDIKILWLTVFSKSVKENAY